QACVAVARDRTAAVLRIAGAAGADRLAGARRSACLRTAGGAVLHRRPVRRTLAVLRAGPPRGRRVLPGTFAGLTRIQRKFSAATRVLPPFCHPARTVR